jgi:predicted peptidase
MYDHIIRRALLFREVDPNRIYIMGISEGGYAAASELLTSVK